MTSGYRWCSAGIPSATSLTPGSWQNVSGLPCNGNAQPPPFGSVNSDGSSATFSSVSNLAFPFIWRAAPSMQSPFPSTGDFILDVKMQFRTITGNGVGLAVASYSSGDAIGDNPTNYPGRILTL